MLKSHGSTGITQLSKADVNQAVLESCLTVPMSWHSCPRPCPGGPAWAQVLYVLARTLGGGTGAGLRSTLGTAIGGLGHVGPTPGMHNDRRRQVVARAYRAASVRGCSASCLRLRNIPFRNCS